MKTPIPFKEKILKTLFYLCKKTRKKLELFWYHSVNQSLLRKNPNAKGFPLKYKSLVNELPFKLGQLIILCRENNRKAPS
jgi:hypothetical protein